MAENENINPDQADEAEIAHRAAVSTYQAKLREHIESMNDAQHQALGQQIGQIRLNAAKIATTQPDLLIAASDYADALLKVAGLVVVIDELEYTVTVKAYTADEN